MGNFHRCALADFTSPRWRAISSDETMWDRPRCKWVKHFWSPPEPFLSALDLMFRLQSGRKLSTKRDVNCQSNVFPCGPQGLGPVRMAHLPGLILTHILVSYKRGFSFTYLMTSLFGLGFIYSFILGFLLGVQPVFVTLNHKWFNTIKVSEEAAAPHHSLECVELPHPSNTMQHEFNLGRKTTVNFLER